MTTDAITPPDLKHLKAWFTAYAATFCRGDVEQQRNGRLKEEHTHRVCREIVDLGEQVGLDAHQRALAETIALFHDIGRFEQYAHYRTFRDGISENHAHLGVAVLEKEGVLSGLALPLQSIILQAIAHHNVAVLPQAENEAWHFYTRLLRDADKLDIWRVVTEYYETAALQRNETIELGLPDSPGYSPQVVEDLRGRRIVRVNHLRNLNDFKLLQMGWIFDINFAPTMLRVRERGYLEKIRKGLPRDAEIDRLYAMMQAHQESFHPAEVADLIRNYPVPAAKP